MQSSTDFWAYLTHRRYYATVAYFNTVNTPCQAVFLSFLSLARFYISKQPLPFLSYNGIIFL